MIAQKFFLANKINSTEFLMWHREYVINAYISTYLPVPGNRKDVWENCKNIYYYCGTLLMIDNWTFKKDYPYKF